MKESNIKTNKQIKNCWGYYKLCHLYEIQPCQYAYVHGENTKVSVTSTKFSPISRLMYMLRTLRTLQSLLPLRNLALSVGLCTWWGYYSLSPLRNSALSVGLCTCWGYYKFCHLYGIQPYEQADVHLQPTSFELIFSIIDSLGFNMKKMQPNFVEIEAFLPLNAIHFKPYRCKVWQKEKYNGWRGGCWVNGGSYRTV